MFDGWVADFKRGWNRADEELAAEKKARKAAAERQARVDALTGGKLDGGAFGGAGYVGEHLLKSFGSANLDQVFNTWAPHLTTAIYTMYSNMYAQAQQAATWKARCEELEKRCAEQSRIIEALTKEKANAFRM